MPELVDFLDDITNAIIHPGFQKLKETDLGKFVIRSAMEYNDQHIQFF